MFKHHLGSSHQQSCCPNLISKTWIQDLVNQAAILSGWRRCLLDGKEIIAGRSADCSLFLDDITVSRNHAKFTEVDGAWFIEDLGSLNGTYVNNTIIDSKVVLENQMEIQIGKFHLVFISNKSKSSNSKTDNK
jgi:pSer/pThr/pTyr-binding forkhead associated (FHA) protein